MSLEFLKLTGLLYDSRIPITWLAIDGANLHIISLRSNVFDTGLIGIGIGAVAVENSIAI